MHDSGLRREEVGEDAGIPPARHAPHAADLHDLAGEHHGTRRLPAGTDLRPQRHAFRARRDSGLGRGGQGRHAQHAPLRTACGHQRRHPLGGSRRPGAMSTRPVRAYLWMLSSALSFSTMGALSRLLSDSSDWRFLAFIRAALMLLFAGLIALGTRTPFSVIGTPILWMRSLVGSLSMICTYYTLTHDLPFAEATTLIKSYPIWVALLSWAILRDRPSAKVWVAILTGAAGVVAISQPHFDHASVTLGVGMLSALCTAVVMLGLNKLSAVQPRAIVLHFALISTVVTGAVYLTTASRAPIGAFTDSRGLAMLLAMGLLGTVGQIALTKAFASGDPSKVSVVGLSELIFGVFYDRVLWSRHFGVITLAGIAMVAAPTAWLLATGRRARPESPAPLESSATAEAP